MSAFSAAGRAEAISEPRPMISIHPEQPVSWGLDGDANGADR